MWVSNKTWEDALSKEPTYIWHARIAKDEDFV
jgi:hypothetical protein